MSGPGEPSWKRSRRRRPRRTSGRIRKPRRSFCSNEAGWSELSIARKSLKPKFPTPQCSLSLLNQTKLPSMSCVDC